VNQLTDGANKEDQVVKEFSDVFPEELLGIPPDHDIEFIIELLPGTAPIAKRPYRMGVDELEELKKQIKELQDKGFIRPSSSPWGYHQDGTQRMCVDYSFSGYKTPISLFLPWNLPPPNLPFPSLESPSGYKTKLARLSAPSYFDAEHRNHPEKALLGAPP
jgi:hypothetical protein